MTRTFQRRRSYGFRTTPDDIRECFTFLRIAAHLVRKGLPDTAPRPWAARRIPGSWVAAFRRRP